MLKVTGTGAWRKGEERQMARVTINGHQDKRASPFVVWLSPREGGETNQPP